MYVGSTIDLSMSTMDFSDRPAELGRVLGLPFGKVGNTLYVVTDGKMCMYDLQKNTFHPNDEKELFAKYRRFSPDYSGETHEASQTAPENFSPSSFACALRHYGDASGAGSEAEAAKKRRCALRPREAPLAHWVSMANGAVRSEGGVCVGQDLDGGRLFVGRVYLFGCLLPGKVAERHNVFYVAWEGREYTAYKYEVLVVEGLKVRWERCSNGHIPRNALPCGYSVRGDTIYSARAITETILTPGHIVKGEKQCRISYDMKEYSFTEYEILTLEPPTATDEDSVPPESSVDYSCDNSSATGSSD